MKILRVNARALGWITAGYALFLAVALAIAVPGLLSKNKIQRTDSTVLLALDAESLDALHAWPIVLSVPCTHIALDAAAAASQEMAIRSVGKNVLWKISDGVTPTALLSRVQPGDLAWVTDGALDHPQIYLDLPSRLADRGGVCAVEFDRNTSLAGWTSRFSIPVMKTHVLATREMLDAKPAMWNARLCRAVEERWIRCLIVHLSPALTLSDNIHFLNDVAATLRAQGFIVQNHVRRLAWPLAPLSTSMRWALVLFVSIATPLLGLYWVRRVDTTPTLAFGLVSAFSVVTGVLIHALGATPAFVQGLQPLHGLKLQLGGALVIALPFLFSFDDIVAALKQSVTSRAVAVWATLIAVALILYWMRSGNHPLLSVSDAERGVRDGLERFLVVRPRFKEFLFGHPLFFMGLSLARRPIAGRWWGDGRVFLWLGLVGQISILNTFTHFQTPFSICVLRTLYGLFLGWALAIAAQRLLQLMK